VEPAEVGDGSFDGRLHLIGRRDVAADADRGTAVVADPSDRVRRVVLVGSTTATDAPSVARRCAVAAPMPRPAPVTRATCPPRAPAPVPSGSLTRAPWAGWNHGRPGSVQGA
jgi:hypothetical protein